MFRIVFALLILVSCTGFVKAQIPANQLVGKYWLYIKDANLKTDEYFEIKPGDGQTYVFTWPDHSSCKLSFETGTSYHLECKDEKLKVTFEEDASKKIKGFTLHLSNEKMYGMKSE